MDVSSRYELDELKMYEVRESTQDEEQDFLERGETSFFSNTVETGFSAITDCFSSCWGVNSEAELEENDLEPNFIELAARVWWNPNPYRKENIEGKNDDGSLIRSGHILKAGFSILNTVAKVFFTVISFVPGSSSDFMKDEIFDVDGWANAGFLPNLCAQNILPSLFTVLAVTVNPFAEMKKIPDRVSCLGDRVFGEAVRYARTGMAFEKGSMQFTNESDIKEMLQRNVVSRFLFLTATVILVVEKIVHLAIGVILTACAVLTLFRDEDLNNSARKYLGALDVIDTVCIGLRAVLYPWQNLGKDINLSYYRDPSGVMDTK